jgi:hypothetical protein
MHFRRALRRRTERQVKEHLERMGADVTEYLEVRWFGRDYSPVAYGRKNGKPHWKVSRSFWNDPESEASDCKSEKLDADSEEWASDFEKYWFDTVRKVYEFSRESRSSATVFCGAKYQLNACCICYSIWPPHVYSFVRESRFQPNLRKQ